MGVELNKIYQGNCLDVLKTLPDRFVNTVITSPPYFGLRDYGVDGQLGLEETPEIYVKKLVEIFREIRRTLRDDGTVWLNLGDSYWTKRSNNGLGYIGNTGKSKDYMLRSGNKDHSFLKSKDMIGIPWRVAFALQEDGWYLRSDIIWNKPNIMPQSVTDRPTKSHEYIFLLSKSKNYYYDHEAIKEDSVYKEYSPVRGSDGASGPPQSRIRKSADKGTFTGKHGDEAFRAVRNKRNKRTVWTVTTKPVKEAHFATYPVDLIEPCVIAGCPVDGIVMDPFIGSGTTAVAAIKHDRNYIGIDLNPDYIEISDRRLNEVQIELI